MLIRYFLVFLTVSGCCCQCGPQKESYVSDVPATLKDAKALEKPPKVIVTVERVTKTRSGGAGCGHSAACIILVPFLLWDAAFPEKYDTVSVKEDGQETFGATYTTGGDLIHGLKELSGGKKKEVLALNLDALGKRVIVESAQISADGKRTPVPLQKQHDFVGDYAKAVAKTVVPDERGKLLTEELQWLGDEAVPVVRERLKDSKEHDRSKAHVVKALCAAHGPEAPTYEKELLGAVTQPGPLTALALLPCADDDAARGVLIEAVVAGLCLATDARDFDDLEKELWSWTGEKSALTPHVSKAAKACTVPERRALLALKLGEPVEPDNFVKLLAGPLLKNVEDSLQLDKPEQRDAYFKAIATGANTARLLRKMTGIEGPLKPHELEAFARAYTDDDDTKRYGLLYELQKHHEDCETGPARAVIAAKRDQVELKEQPKFEVALVVLGDSTRLEAARKGLDEKAPYRVRDTVKEGLQLSGHLPKP